MKHQVPECKFTTTTTQEGSSQNFRCENFGLPPDFIVPQTDHVDHSCWTIDSSSGPIARDHNIQEIFGGLLNIHKGFPSELDSKDQSNGRETTAANNMEIESASGESKQKPDERRVKRTRAAELHNMSERKRRNGISGKMKALQELIPNCNKSDRASTLDDAIKYLKALQLQVQMMSMGGAIYQASNLSMAGIPSPLIPQFMSYVPVGMGMRMGMVSQPAATAGGLPLMSEPGVLPVIPDQLRMPMPVLASQVMPAAGTGTTPNMVQPQSARDFSHTFNYANQGESTSQKNTINAAAADSQRVPTLSQDKKTITKSSSMQSVSKCLQLGNN